MRKLLTLSGLLVLLSISGQQAFGAPANNMPNVQMEMQKVDFWVDKIGDADKVMMDLDKITDYNVNTAKNLPKIVFDLSAYQSALSKNELNSYVTQEVYLNKNLYLGSNLVGQDYYKVLKLATNLAGIKDENQVAYGFTVRKANMRVFPTDDILTLVANDKAGDALQISVIQPVEAVLVLHKSVDTKWYFVQTYNGRGWIKAENVALAKNRETWLKYLYIDKFLMVTSSKMRLGYNPYSPELSELEFGMGTKLPLWDGEKPPKTIDNQGTAGNYAVKLPVRTSDGLLAFKAALVNGNSDVTEGYFPFTKANLLKQAFKMQGERDKPSYIVDIFRSFGVKMPLGINDQSTSAGKNISFAKVSDIERKRLMQTLLPGAILYLPDNVLLYLGSNEGRYYAIHNLNTYWDGSQRNSDGTLKSVIVNQVVVSDLSLILKNGKTLFDSIIAAKAIQGEGSVQDTIYNQTSSGVFIDIADHWAKQDIEMLAELNILKGKTDDQFLPKGNITRAEFATLLARALKLPEGTAAASFKDIEGQWFAKDVTATVNAGIIKGYENATFQPSANITRTEMAMMVSRAMTHAKAGKKITNIDQALTIFNDKGLIKQWAKEDIAVTAVTGIIKGNREGKFAPTASTTRAEAATIMKRLMTYLKLIK